MAGLMTVAVGRDPLSAPVGLAEAPAIHTHPVGSAGRPVPVSALHRALADPASRTDVSPDEYREPDPKGAAPGSPAAEGPSAHPSLHDRLYAAWVECDWTGLAAIARGHLHDRSPKPQLHPVTVAAIEFFQPRTPGYQAGDTERFVASFPDGVLRSYAAQKAEPERRSLADDALALHCLGMLGGARFDYISALRAIEAVTVCARLWDLGADELGIAPGLIDRIVEMDVVLPRWSFEIDPCRCCDEGWPEESPLERKLAGIERRDTGARPDSDCVCTPNPAPCLPTDPCCAKVNYYIADLLELRDWTHRYKAGDLAYIENIAAGETRSRDHEMKRTRELFSEMETTERRSESRDLQVTDRSSLKREIDRQREQSLSGEASATGKFTGTGYSAEISASASFARSSKEAVREAQEHAVETVKKAVSEIEKETRTKRSEKITTEETEKNLHAFKNETDEALVTKYFWVTKECRAQLYSYGRQMIAEFIVPEPARLYEHLLLVRRESQIDAAIRKPTAVKPEKPEALGFESASMTSGNYVGRCEQWGVSNPPSPPAATGQIAVGLSDGDNRGDGEHVGDMQFQVPDGYRAVAMTLSGSEPEWRRPKEDPHKVEFNCAGDTMFWSKEESSHKLSTPLGNLTGSQSIAVDAWYTDSFSATVTIQLELLPSVLIEWQQSVFDLIEQKHAAAVAAYEEALAKYEAIIAEYEQERDKLRRELIEGESSRHPFFNREIEQAELKRAVIYLMCQDFSANGAMIRRAEPCGFPEIDRTATDEKGYDWYFWDRLIDWKRMAYAFFDYFWAPMCDWPQRFDPDEPDALFKAFRRAGYARVLVPVSPAMHKDFLWYLATHEKWNHQGPPFGDQDPRWRNVVFELKHANEAAMTAREGHVDVTNGGNFVTIKGSDRYYNPAGTGLPDPAMIALDIDREIYIDGEVYLIVGITLNAGSPPYNILTPDTGWWDLTLDRVYAGATGTGLLYAMGAKAVAPPFSFDMPTELIWAGDKGKCLPTYPLPPCVP
jgi:hypothetical protein